MNKKNKHMIASKRKCAPSELEAKNACAKKIISPGLSEAKMILITIAIVIGSLIALFCITGCIWKFCKG